MIGHKSARYLRFGWAAARLDDLMNVLPARITALATALAAPFLGGSAVASLRVCLRDGRSHPSPNAGVAEAAFAGALGVRLGGPCAIPTAKKCVRCSATAHPRESGICMRRCGFRARCRM